MVTFPKIIAFSWIQHLKQTILKYVWGVFLFITLKQRRTNVSHLTLQNYLRAVNRVLNWELRVSWALIPAVVETLVCVESASPHQGLTFVRTSRPSSSIVSEKHIASHVVDMRALKVLFSHKTGTLGLCSTWEDSKCWTFLHPVPYDFLLPF